MRATLRNWRLDSVQMAQKDGVESDLVHPSPRVYAGNRVVGRIKHSPPVSIRNKP